MQNKSKSIIQTDGKMTHQIIEELSEYLLEYKIKISKINKPIRYHESHTEASFGGIESFIVNNAIWLNNTVIRMQLGSKKDVIRSSHLHLSLAFLMILMSAGASSGLARLYLANFNRRGSARTNSGTTL